MKKIVCLIALGLMSCADAKQDQVTLKVDKKLNIEHTIKVSGCEIQYKDKKVNFNDSLQTWLKTFGSHYRAVNHTDYTINTGVEIPKTYYVYDDLGVRLIYNINGKKMEHMAFALERSILDQDFYREETTEEYNKRMNDPESYQAKKDFKDGILVEDVILGPYPMDDEVRRIASNRHSTEYNIYANCTKNQKDGEDFNIRVNSSFSNPEIITGFSFYVDVPTEIPEEVSLKAEYEICKGFSDFDIQLGIGAHCPDVRKRYEETLKK
ncbi:hypothetical protein G9F32_13620 [Acinetobacter sp. 194]|uniref:DUF7738 domain-containing protein n=1 Tax=Acinetobacter shaoyimingii TaxID=2715164 RepID=UPI0014074E21|nr:hypothetical protein [Acinetobacter shaoyimingii]NHB59043.1 hypothetical protein [Acinetobacter shaoyimingii]